MENTELTFICASLDEDKTIEKLLKDLNKKTENQSLFKISLIFIDQNHKERSKFCKKLYPNIKYIHSSKLGLAYNRNIGLKNLKTDLYTFIDSDCKLDENYFESLFKVLIKTKEKNKILIYGKIVDSETGNDLFKKWPKKERFLKEHEKLLFSTSVNIVYKNTKVFFDENFGLGSIYPSCEDLDYALRTPGYIYYSNEIVITHPHQNFNENDEKKIFNYAKGFGALCKKQGNFIGFILLIASIFHALFKLFKKTDISKVKASIKGKITGFIEYKK